MAQNANNPFFNEWNTSYGAPPFEQIKNEHYLPAFEEGMKLQKQEIEAIINNKKAPDFENTIVVLDKAGKFLGKVSAVFYGINSANTNPDMQKIAASIAPKLSLHRDEIRLNPELFKRVKAVYDKSYKKLKGEEKRLLEETYKSFVRGGAELSAQDQVKLKELNGKLSMLQLTFSQNMLAETAAFQVLVDKESDLAGLSADLKTAAAERAKKAGYEGKWLFGLDNPTIMPFLQYADNRYLREVMLRGYLNRGNNFNKNDNKPIIEQLIALRLEKAKLMSNSNFAEFALLDRMAKNPEAVYNLLDQIWAPAINVAKKDAADMQDYIKKNGGDFGLEAWDWRYYSEKLMSERFGLNDDMTRPYFKLENVRDGMFYVVNKLYGITFTEVKDIPKPTSEASAFECKDADGTHLGILYFDFFARPGTKNGGAWCGGYRSQSYENGKRVAPLVTIVSNFTRPVGNKPALLSADEVETCFHEFGHALHSLFRNVKYQGVGGVPRDFVELPSQIMEHWAFEPEVLKVYAKHYQTGEVIPQELIDKMERSGKFGQGFATTEYLAASYLDMDYHVLTSIPANFSVLDFEANTLAKRGLIKQIPPRYRSTYFSHTMGGGYTAGYYSYIWAEVLDADAFEAFKEKGDIFDKETATKFRKEILERGGTEDAMTMYVKFRGAEPKIDALLKNRGLK
ncbi:MAG: M3 family metallopeptidase [Prevotellaceae bacterium]|nr:M3 family metallopeptidase [Prevotellaceae bacterium]